jgi:hypothetical protein
MRLKRPPSVASNPEPAGGHRARAGVVRTLSVAALAAAACALSALPALASSSAPGADGTVATTTTMTSPASNVYSYVNAGQSFTLQATVAAADGSEPTGTVAFTAVDYPGTVPPNLECPSVTLTAADDGNAQCTVTTGVGTWGFVLYQATYTPTAGSEWNTSNTVGSGDHKLVTWDITTTLLTFAPSPATVGNPVTLTADVKDEPLDALADAYSATPDVVTFSIGGVAIPGCTNVAVTDPSNGPNNIATCTYTPTATGPVSIEAAYSGDDYALKSSDTETLTVNPHATVATKTAVSVSPKTADIKQLVKLSASVTASGSTPTGTVTFWVSTRKLCTVTLSGGKGTCSAAFPNAGPKTIVGKYSGSSTDEASSGSAPLTINK